MFIQCKYFHIEYFLFDYLGWFIYSEEDIGIFKSLTKLKVSFELNETKSNILLLIKN